jgi:hypothetical protein
MLPEVGRSNQSDSHSRVAIRLVSALSSILCKSRYEYIIGIYLLVTPLLQENGSGIDSEADSHPCQNQE